MRGWYRRVISTVVTAWIVVTLAFVMVRSAPGGPFDQQQTLHPLVKAHLQHAYGLDQPLWRQYLVFLQHLAEGDLGPSLANRDFSVNQLLAIGLPVSLELGVAALLLTLVLALPLGIYSATHARRVRDHGLGVLSALAVATPAYVLAPCLVLLFSVHLRWLPAGGWDPHRLANLVLPVLSLALPLAGSLSRMVRVSVLEALQLPHVVAARAKGLRESQILLHHVLPLAWPTILSALRPTIAGLLTGSLVVESIFGLPGMGRFMVEGALNRDYSLVVGKVVVYFGLVLVTNLVIDLLQARLDPRLRRAAP